MSNKHLTRRLTSTVCFDSDDPRGLTERPVALNPAEIEEVASHYRIPLYEDPGVVEALARLDLSAVIPLEVYGVIADVLGYVYRLDT